MGSNADAHRREVLWRRDKNPPVSGSRHTKRVEMAAAATAATAAAATAQSLSPVRLCATPETAAHQASPSLGFSRQEHWNGLYFLFQCMKVKSEREVAQSCSTLSDPMDCSLPGSSVHGIFQARVLEWVNAQWKRGNTYLDKDQNKCSGLLNIFVCDLVLNCSFLLLLVEIPWKWLIMLRHLDMIIGFVMEMAMRMRSS